MKILVANPAGNITIFVLDSAEGASERAGMTRAIMADGRLGAEQVGFVIPAGSSGPALRQAPEPALWRLEMAGGEFCGNASRSFGLYVAQMQGLKGTARIAVSVSGAEEPVITDVDLEKNLASAEMPKPRALETLNFDGRSLPAVVFEGITHVIACGLKPESKTFYAIMAVAERKLKPFPALGVMFCDASCAAASASGGVRSIFMRPAVYVRNTGTLVFESSCGSGSAAMGVWLARELGSGAAVYAIAQPGGVIETKVTKKSGEIAGLTIGGEVKLGAAEDFPWPADIVKNTCGGRFQ